MFQDIVSTYVEGALDRKILLQLFECSEMQTEDTCKGEGIRGCALFMPMEILKILVYGITLRRLILRAANALCVECGYPVQSLTVEMSQMRSARCGALWRDQSASTSQIRKCVMQNPTAPRCYPDVTLAPFILLHRECPLDCWMSVDNQAMDVTKADSDLKAAYDKLGKACSSYETEEACQTTT